MDEFTLFELQEAIDQVEEWEKNGTSQLLAKSKMNRGYYY
jgi:hypothetical protein